MTIIDKTPVELSPKSVTMVLLSGAIGLTLLHVCSMFIWYKDLIPLDSFTPLSFFDLDEEESLGTWFSSLLLFFAGLLTLFQTYYIPLKIPRWNFLWGVLGWGLIAMSLDEVAAFHEFLNTAMKTSHWTTFGMILVTLLGLSFLPFLRALPQSTLRLFIAAGIVYLGGALGVEWATIWYQENDLLNTLGYNLWNAVEEFMEMLGVIVYIYALLLHMAHEHFEKAFSITLTPEHPHPADKHLFK